jgi:hypothetical protein
MPVVRIQWALTLYGQGRTGDACRELEHVLAAGRADPGDQQRIKRLLNEWRSAVAARR